MRTEIASHRRPALTLTVLCMLGLGLGVAPASYAVPYSAVGEFNQGKANTAIAVNQESNDVYVTNFNESTAEFDSSGNPLNEAFTAPASSFGEGPDFLGAAVNPSSHDVYLYDSVKQEIDTYGPTGGTEVRALKVAGGDIFTAVQIASEPLFIYYPDQAENTIQKFLYFDEGSASPIASTAGSGEHAFVKPQAVAVDAAHKLIYVVDEGNGGATPGRVQAFENGESSSEPATYRSTLDEKGSQDVTVDPENGDVYVLDLNGEGSCGSSPPCYRVRAYHYGETTPFAEFGAGTIVGAGSLGEPPRIAVDHGTGAVYVSDPGSKKTWIFKPVELPVLTTGTASVTGTTAPQLTATLNGAINPKGAPTTYRFEYATETADYGTAAAGRIPVPDAFAGEGVKEVQISQTIGPEAQGALEGSSTYHYRLVATAYGTQVTEKPEVDHTFTTPALPPVVAEGAPAYPVAHTEATVDGTVNPENQATTWTFEYGTSPTYTSSAPVLGGEVTGSSPQPVHAQLPNLAPNTAYHYSLVAKDGACANPPCETQGPDQIVITPPPPPSAVSGAASGLGQSAATLSGAVTPGSEGPNSDTTWHFQYGPTAGYGHETTVEDAGTGTGAVPVSAVLEGLTPNTTYHYRLLAANNNQDSFSAPQSVEGRDRTFTTLPVEPLAGQPTGMSETGVTLNGDVDPSGHPLEYRFEYGPSTAYGQSTPLASAGEGSEYTPVSGTLTGLAPGTYHWRLVAVGADGNTYSSDSTFTLYAAAPAQTGNPFSAGQGTAAPFPTIPLLSTPTFPAPPTETVTPPPKPLTNAEKLTKALKQCRKEKSKKKRLSCEKAAKARYGLKTNAKKK